MIFPHTTELMVSPNSAAHSPQHYADFTQSENHQVVKIPEPGTTFPKKFPELLGIFLIVSIFF